MNTLNTKRINPIQPRYHKTDSPEAFYYGTATLRGEQITRYTDCLWRIAFECGREYERKEIEQLNKRHKLINQLMSYQTKKHTELLRGKTSE
uniref:Uncharacterized protein n=1 Tax=viral metagenome TaxID=1070528 RepID=A0A6M3J3W9_9ZZZZ